MHLKKKVLGLLLCIMIVATVVPSNCWQMIAAAISYVNSGEIIEFGSYPQSQVTDETDLSALNALLTEESWQSYGYYSGTGEVGTMTSSDYMKYADVEYNGIKFRAVTFSAYRPSCSYALSSVENSHQDDNAFSTDNIYWFRFEALKWCVLNEDTRLVLCGKAI